MKDLIQALQILQKYLTQDVRNPTHCEHDILQITPEIEDGDVSEEDTKELDRLGFFWSEKDECFCSYRFGSC